VLRPSSLTASILQSFTHTPLSLFIHNSDPHCSSRRHALTHRSYLPLVPLLIVLACIPNYTLRIHHYLYTFAAIPVLSLPNRVSLFGQAFMLGLFLDGVGRWGWASIIEQTTSVSGAPGCKFRFRVWLRVPASIDQRTSS
jgi:hypothetical protein